MAFTYIAFYKPFDVLSQFTKEIETHKTLADHLDVAKDIYPVGRLDRDSEGLLLLTNDKQLNHKLLDPKYKHPRTYWVQVDGASQKDVCIYRLSSLKINKSFYSKFTSRPSPTWRTSNYH